MRRLCEEIANAQKAKWKWMYRMFKHACGPAFLFDPAWRTTDAIAIARGIVAERAFDRMPILADALQDAGMQDEELLAHLQFDGEEWGASDWVLTELLGVD